MARSAELKNVFAKGVIDPRLEERVDLAHYYHGVRTGRNIIFRPQGGFRRRGGSDFKGPDRLRHNLEPVHISVIDITAHNGGTTALLLDQDETTLFTTDPVSDGIFVVAEFSLTKTMPVAFFDIVNFSTSLAGSDDAIVVEYWDGMVWVPVPGADFEGDVSARKNIRTSPRTRRFGGRPGWAGLSDSWRIVIYDAAGAGAVNIGEVRMWTENGAIYPVKIEDFSKSSNQIYQIVMSERNLDIFKDGVYAASVPVAVTLDQIKEVNVEQSLDTIFQFHKDLAPAQIVRQGADDEWNYGKAIFINVPDLTTSSSFSGNTDEVQEITFPELTPGDDITVFLGEVFTNLLNYSTPGNLVNDVLVALETLPSVAAGGIKVDLVGISPVTIKISFTGVNGGRRWPVLDAVVHGSTERPKTSILQNGLNASGKIIGEDTGWPRAGAFVQSRLILGGSRAAPQTLIGTITGFGASVFNFDKSGDPLTADMGIEYTFDSDEIETINDIFVGRHLQVFTDEGEWWLENRFVDATQPMNFILGTRHGASPAVPLVFLDTSTVFMQKPDENDKEFSGDSGGQVLRDFLYSNETENYEAEPLSLLGPHLLREVVSMAHKKARTIRTGNQLYMVNRDGTMAVLTLLRSQEVVAMSESITLGLYVDISVDRNNSVWQIVERGGELLLEEQNTSGLLDSAIHYSGVTATQFGGLGHLEGQQVWALADGDLAGPFEVASGAITLPFTATEVSVGLAFFGLIETLPHREELQNEEPFRLPARIYELELSLISTGQVSVGINDNSIVDMPIRFFDGLPLALDRNGEQLPVDDLGTALMDRLYTGHVKLENIPGFSRHPRITITQQIPAPLECRSLRYEMSF